MTTYTLDELRNTAKWALEGKTCCEGQHKLTLKHVELCIAENNAVALHIVGECKRHHYTLHTNCAI